MVHKQLYEDFLKIHRPQLIASGVPQHLWISLYHKVSKQIFDAGKVFSLLRIEYEEGRAKYDPVWQLQVNVEEGIEDSHAEQIYLIDHAWTFRTENIREQLQELPALRCRMANLMGLDQNKGTEELIDDVFEEMWKYCNYYSIGNTEDIEARIPVWYIMDEVGSSIQHSDAPNFRMIPFFYATEQITYSVIFPIKTLKYGEVVTRDFVEGEFTKEERSAFLLPWRWTSFLDVNYKHEEPEADYFLSGHIQETLPDMTKTPNFISKKSKYKVFSEYSFVVKYLTDPKFEIVTNENEADILWYTHHYKTFKELSETPEKFINQFPFEYVLTIKDLLSIVCRRKTPERAEVPAWLPTTYNLKTELIKFVSYFQKREDNEQDNYWIIKPFNLARGLDTHITNNLFYIMRLATTGPKIAQKYIQHPVLFQDDRAGGKVKFDIRYVLLLVSVKPLILYAYKNFFLRFANKPFELKYFDDYSKHFTVMNYTNKGTVKHMLCSAFKNKWQSQFPDHSWNTVEDKIFKMFREVFECAVVEPPPCGIAESPQSRALYAADIILEWNESDIQPKLLEINWMPDCQRACEYYPSFYNNIFNLLFFDTVTEVFHKL